MVTRSSGANPSAYYSACASDLDPLLVFFTAHAFVCRAITHRCLYKRGRKTPVECIVHTNLRTMRVLRGLIVTFTNPTRVLSRTHVTLSQKSFAETLGHQNRKCPLCGLKSGDLLAPVRSAVGGSNVRTMAAFGGREDDFIFRQVAIFW